MQSSVMQKKGSRSKERGAGRDDVPGNGEGATQDAGKQAEKQLDAAFDWHEQRATHRSG